MGAERGWVVIHRLRAAGGQFFLHWGDEVAYVGVGDEVSCASNLDGVDERVGC